MILSYVILLLLPLLVRDYSRIRVRDPARNYCWRSSCSSYLLVESFNFLLYDLANTRLYTIKSALYGENCVCITFHMPSKARDDLSLALLIYRDAANFLPRDAALSAFCPAVSGWLPTDRFEGESRISCRMKCAFARMKQTLENRRSLRQHANRLVREQRICCCYTRGLFMPATLKLRAVK